MIKHVFLYAIFTMLFSPTFLMANSSKILISEFMAVNSNSIVDGDGDHSDWIELYNNTSNSIDLKGWFLTDKADNLKKWEFPSVVIAKGAYLVIFASEKDTTDSNKSLHTNFKLSGSGEYLAICEPDSTISYAYSPLFPSQGQDVSYGIYKGEEVYFTTSTPGTENLSNDVPFAPNFSSTRGFYKSALDVTLSSPTVNCPIYYTLDGTRPSKTTGKLYSTPIHISKTTPLSAVAINTSNQSSEIITNTYWFVDDILKQSATPAGYPLDWKQESSSTTIEADYEMDPEVCNSSDYKDVMEEALTSIPSMNIVTTKGYLFSDANDDNNGGIYIYTGKPSGVGRSWVRPTSVEYYDPSTGKDFQLNCQLKLHGGNSRNPANSNKHGFELAFTSAYGPSKLNFNLFDEKDATNEFNSLVLRSGYNYSWTLMSDFYPNHFTQRENAQYLQDPWAKTTQMAMGKTSGHQRFVHLYINGLYWGLYNVAEEYTNDFMESYMKGDEADFDIIKEKQEAVSGNIVAFNDLNDQMNSDLANNSAYQKLQGNNPDGTVNTTYANLLDVDNYIDYMLLNYYIGNLDWNKNNWTMARNRVSNKAGFRFLCWDAETTMTDINTDLVSASADDKNPAAFIKYLIENNDFKVLMADRVQKHLINEGGALTPSVASERYVELANIIDKPIIGESARWGDCSAAKILYTKNDDWLPRKKELLDTYFPYRSEIVIEQLKKQGYFPSVDAPEFTHNGGVIASRIDLGISSNKGVIYYTTDGSDPRTSSTGAVASTATRYTDLVAVNSSVTVKARSKYSSEWSAITKAKFVYDINNATNLYIKDQLALSSYPNPFKEATSIKISVPVAGNLEVDIYSIDGRLIENIFQGEAHGGDKTITWSAQGITAGVYICQITYQGENYYLKLMKN